MEKCFVREKPYSGEVAILGDNHSGHEVPVPGGRIRN